MKTFIFKTGIIMLLSLFLLQKSAFAQDNPNANFSHILSCDGLTVAFMDSSSDPNGHTIESWLWDFGDGNTSTEQNPTHIYADNASYSINLTVWNDIGGFDTFETIINATAFSASFSVNNLSCFGLSDGDIMTTVVGGNPPYNYIWSNNSSAENLSGLPAGDYSVTITDNNECSVIESINVLSPSELILVFETSGCIGDSVGGWATAIVTGGVTPYTYIWSTGYIGHTHGIISTGLHSVTVIDQNDCQVIGYVALNYCNYTLSGYVFIDSNENGIFDEDELPVPNVLVHSAPGPFYGYTNAEGYYTLPLNIGQYTIAPSVAHWYSFSEPGSGFHYVNITSLIDTMQNVNFGLVPDTICTYLEVSLAIGTIRPCLHRQLFLKYKNSGLAIATDVYIEVEFDDNFSPVSSVPAWDSLVGDKLYYGIGTLNPSENGNIYIQYYTDCDFNIVGQTRCFTANIFPQEMCELESEEWDKSSISVTGYCDNDSIVSFVISNTGEPGEGDMESLSEYRIFENELMVFYNSFQINGGENLIINWPANGEAIRLEADQHPFHPGNSQPNAVVENCGDLHGVSFGLITSFPFDNANPFTDIACRIVVNSYDPNDKHVYPSGITEHNYVDNFSKLTYLINFQNTGSDTAFVVVVTDTLPELLDITTVVPGAASHSYTFRIFGEGILEWTFDNINLVDSATNELGSQGFLTFEVEQIEIPLDLYGSIISNRASIYFDFNPPIITEPAWLTIWELPLIPTLLPEKQSPNYNIMVYPNPINSSATVEVEGIVETEGFELQLFSISGQLIISEKCYGNKMNIHRRELPVGVYIYRITSGSEFVGSGKLIIE